jgi:adenylate cyclase
MLADGRTVFVSDQALSGSRSMLGLEVVAAAPIKDRDGKVIGAVYGERRKQSTIPRTINNEEALLLQLIARAVATSLNRLQAEEGARRELTRLTVYMSDQQAQAVLLSPDWRTGRPMSVSVLFCDVVGSTDILSARTALSAEAMRWSGAVLELLTRCVRESGGTLIDYTGDGLFALWGAPIAMDNHADRACSAAVAMADGMREINAVWEPKIRQRTDLRIGLNSGPVTVGNIGTSTFEKFGAYGEDVNLGKRMETAAKSLQARILLHESAGRALAGSGKYAIRRLRTIRVKGSVRPFDVYEVSPNHVAGREKWDEAYRKAWRDLYEKALGLFESGKEDNVREAGVILGRWREENRWDRAALVLLANAVNALAENKFGEEMKVLDLS